MPESYFGRDKVHLNSHGTKRLLRNIDNICLITKGSSGPSNTGQTYQPQPRLYGMLWEIVDSLDHLGIVIFVVGRETVQVTVGSMAGMLV